MRKGKQRGEGVTETISRRDIERFQEVFSSETREDALRLAREITGDNCLEFPKEWAPLVKLKTEQAMQFLLGRPEIKSPQQRVVLTP